MAQGDPQPDLLIEPFITALLDYREVVSRLVRNLSDDELEATLALMQMNTIPYPFWPAIPTVRSLIKIEKRRRAATPVGVTA